MREELPFLRAIFSLPDEDAPRLVYADWLEERGDPRAEFLRLEVELRAPANAGKVRQTALAKRMADLTSRLNASWVRWMEQTRNLPRGDRLDLAFVDDGKGLIDVRGGEQET